MGASICGISAIRCRLSVVHSFRAADSVANYSEAIRLELIFSRLQDILCDAVRLYFEPLRWVSEPLSRLWHRALLFSSPSKRQARKQFYDLLKSKELGFNLENSLNLNSPASVYRSLAWMASSTSLRKNWGIKPK